MTLKLRQLRLVSDTVLMGGIAKLESGQSNIVRITSYRGRPL